MNERAGRNPGRKARSIAVAASITVLAIAATACGDDRSGAQNASARETTSDTTSPAKSGEPTAENAALCALATKMAGQDSLPSVDQLMEYQKLAPAAVKDAVDTAAPQFVAAGGDPVKFFIALADDDVERAMAEINEWEKTNCGIEEDGGPGGPLADGATREREDDATVVEVVATDHAFRLGRDVLAPGRTSLVLTNEGEEAHFIQLFKMAKGATMKQVMESQDGGSGLIDGSWDSGIAAPGGEDEEVLTLELEPGTYGLSCFISTADGTPHAAMGMTAEFTVS